MRLANDDSENLIKLMSKRKTNQSGLAGELIHEALKKEELRKSYLAHIPQLGV